MTAGESADRPPADPPLIPEGLDATLVLVRHGESELVRENRFQGQLDSPLSETGLRQAQLVAERFAHPQASPGLPVPDGTPRQIVYSPLARARQTAIAIGDAIAAERGIDTAHALAVPFEGVAEPGFLEIHQGEWQGVTHDEISRRWGAELSGWRRRPWETWAPGGESPMDVQARVRPALARVLARLGEDYPRGTLDRPQVPGFAGAATHPDQPWSIVVAHDGVFKVTLLTLFDLPLTKFWMFTLGLTGITVVDIRGGRPVLRAANLVEHLAPLHDEEARARAEARARSGAL